MKISTVKHRLNIIANGGVSLPIQYGREVKIKKYKIKSNELKREKIIMALEEHEYLVIRQIRDITKIAESTAHKMLKEMRSEKIVGCTDRFSRRWYLIGGEQSLPAVGAIAGRDMQREAINE